jgi:hypothetical protein
MSVLANIIKIGTAPILFDRTSVWDGGFMVRLEKLFGRRLGALPWRRPHKAK